MKVQNEMSTRLSVDAVQAIGTMSAFRNSIRGVSSAWRAQEVALKNSGNYTEAAAARYRGLNKVIDLQKAKIEELRSRQEGLDTSNQKQANQFLKLEKQIQQANKQLASYESQSSRARNALKYQTSGLAGLQHAYRQSQEASMAYVNRLSAEHRSASAAVEKYQQLKSSLASLQGQYKKQEFLLKQIANDSGKDSEAYVKQREQLDKTATSIAKTRDQMKSMQSTINRLQPTGITRVDSAIVKMRDRASMATSRLSAGFDNMKNHMMGLAATATTVGIAMVSSINKAASLQKTMVENQNLMSTAGEKSAAVQREVNQMYSDGSKYSVQYGYSQKTIAQGYQELIKRGYDGKQSLGAMQSILEAARASGDSFDDTMKVTTSTLEAFGMRSETTAGMMRNTAKASDILAKAADVTSTSFKDIGVGMEYAGSSAKQSGVSLKETAATLGVLSNNGLEASQAGTGMQRIFTRLAAPTTTATAEMKKYNLSISDFKTKSGQLRNVNEIFKKINANVPKAERLQFFNKVFGQTAQNAAGILSRTADLSDRNSQSLAHVENQLKTAYSEDYVGKLARKNMNSAKNSEERWKYASQAIQIEIGRNMLPALQKASVGMANAFGRKDTQRGLQAIGNGLGKLTMALVDVVEFIGRHTTTVKVFGGALLTAFASVKLLNGIGKFRDMLPRLASGIKGIGTAVKIATLGFNPWVIAIEAVVAGFTLLYKHSAKFRNFVNGLARDAQKGMRNVGKWFKTTFNNISKWHQKSVRNSKKHNQQAQRNWNNYWRSLQRGQTNYERQHSKIEQRNRRNLERQERVSQQRRSRAVANFNRNLIRGSQNMWRQLQRHTQSGERNAERAWNNMSRRIGRTSSSLWRNMSRGARDGWRDVERAASDGSGRVSRWYDQMSKSTSRTIQNMRKQHPRTFGAMYKVIEDRSRTWHDLVTGHWGRLSGDTQRTAQDMRQQHPKLFDTMYKVVEDRSSLWHDVTTGHWNRVSGDTQHLASDMSDAHRQLFGAMYDKLNDLTHGGLDQMRDYWSNTLNKIHDAVVNIGGTIHKAFDSLMNGLIDIFSGLVNGIVDGINWVLNHVGGDGNLQKVNLKHFAKGSNGPIDKHQLAVLNDAPDNDYREMVHKHKTGETFMLPAKRNIMMPLEPGDEVLDGKRATKLMKLMGTPVHHADGAIGDFFNGIFDKSKDALEDATDWVDKALKNVVGFGKSLFSHFMKAVTPKSTDSLNSALKVSLPGFFASRLTNWLKKQLDKLNTDNPPGTGVERWRPVILRAFSALHVAPAGWKVEKLLRQIQTESGGVPDRWQQVHDVNSGGNEARGLLQFAGSTWAADALPGHTDWRKGYNEILAAIHVLENGGEGGWGNVGNGHGWANGGLVAQHGLYEVAENNDPEMIVPLDPNKRGRAYQLLSQVIAQFRNEDGNSSSSVDDQASQQIQNLGRKFDALLAQNQQMINLIDKLIGVTDSVNNPTARYRRTQRDINMAQAQSLIR